jgi:hypothetical protein
MKMEQLPAELVTEFERRLDGASVPTSNRPEYHKWVRFYLYFCQEFDYPPTALGPFLTKLAGNLALAREFRFFGMGCLRAGQRLTYHEDASARWML